MLDYFNGFHDGFMKRIAIESQDRIDEDLGQTCTGLFDVHIDFAHYNYPGKTNPFHPYDQIIEAHFRDVQDILVDFRGGFLGNTIISLTVVAATRRKGGQTEMERCLELRLGRHFYLEAERRYEFSECGLFTFTNARFAEQ